MSATTASTLPTGVLVQPLTPYIDARGSFLELFRKEWALPIEPVQWNAVTSHAKVLRGVHVHIRHDDYLSVPLGRASVGLRDLRRGSPTEGLACVVELGGESAAAIAIPHGVAHGFFFHEFSLHIYAVSRYWDHADELACRWDDPALEIPWPMQTAQVSARDAAAQSLSELLAELAPSQPL
jgi:dTDP-4-dehydrorhamnose 3,5-epimerase